MSPSRGPLLLFLLVAAGGVFLAFRAAFDLGAPEPSGEPRAGAVTGGGAIRLVGTGSPEPSARLETWLRGVEEADRVRLREEIRRMAAADPQLLERLAALARMAYDEEAAAGIGLDAVVLALSFLGAEGARVLAEVAVSGADAYSLAFDALASMGEEAAAATPILLATLRGDLRWDLHPRILDLLGGIGPGALEAAPFLHDLLHPPVEDRLAGTAALALVRIEGATEATLATLRGAILDEETQARAAVIDALASLGSDGAALAIDLLPLLDDLEGRVRGAAAAALGRMRVASPRVVSALLGLLEVEHNSGAAAALGALGPEGEDALRHLARTGEEVSDRIAGLKGLLGAKADLRPLEGVILGILESDHSDGWRTMALEVFQQMTPPPEGEAVLDALVRALDVEPFSLGAAKALARMERAEATQRLLAWVSRSAGPRPGLVAATAFWGVGKDPPGTTTRVVAALDAAEDDGLRSWAWGLLAHERARPAPDDLLPLYDRCLAEEANSSQTKWRALVAVAALDGAEDAVFSRLLDALDVKAVRAAAAAALVDRPQRASESVPALLDAFARAAAAQTYWPWEFRSALAELGPKWPGTRGGIDALIADASPQARRALEYLRASLFGE